MTLKTSIQLTLTALVAVATAVPALGASEPKNGLPFTRPTSAPAIHSTTVRTVSLLSGIVPVGEAKNEAPFTAPYNS